LPQIAQINTDLFASQILLPQETQKHRSKTSVLICAIRGKPFLPKAKFQIIQKKSTESTNVFSVLPYLRGKPVFAEGKI
jgi:hypothetical protein